MMMTRFYRPPEVILLCPDYGKAADIWALGVTFAEMLRCTDPYYGSEDYCPSDRFPFKGNSCFPISPHASGKI
jgi:serine/threonine protein kinase